MAVGPIDGVQHVGAVARAADGDEQITGLCQVLKLLDEDTLETFIVSPGKDIRRIIGQTQDAEPPSRSLPAWLAGSLAVTGETTWRLLRRSSRPPLTRFAYWVSAQECTIRIDKARSELGYEPVKSRPDGLAELRG